MVDLDRAPPRRHLPRRPVGPRLGDRIADGEGVRRAAGPGPVGVGPRGEDRLPGPPGARRPVGSTGRGHRPVRPVRGHSGHRPPDQPGSDHRRPAGGSCRLPGGAAGVPGGPTVLLRLVRHPAGVDLWTEHPVRERSGRGGPDRRHLRARAVHAVRHPGLPVLLQDVGAGVGHPGRRRRQRHPTGRGRTGHRSGRRSGPRGLGRRLLRTQLRVGSHRHLLPDGRRRHGQGPLGQLGAVRGLDGPGRPEHGAVAVRHGRQPGAVGRGGLRRLGCQRLLLRESTERPDPAGGGRSVRPARRDRCRRDHLDPSQRQCAQRDDLEQRPQCRRRGQLVGFRGAGVAAGGPSPVGRYRLHVRDRRQPAVP